MLRAVRWLSIKAALLESGGLLFVFAAILPLALMAYVREPDGVITLALGFGLVCVLVTAVFTIVRGALDAYSYGRKSDEFICRFHAALVESGDIRRS